MTKLDSSQMMVQYMQISVIYHINKRKDKNHMISSIDVEKAFDKMQHLFMIKTLTKMGENICEHNKCYYDKPTKGIPPCSRWEWRQTFHKAILPWSDLVCPLMTQVPSAFLTLPLRQGGDAPGVELMASQTDLVSYHQDLCLICPFLWWHPGCNRVAFWNVSQARTIRGCICVPCSKVLIAVEAVTYKGMTKNPRCPLWVSPCQYM